MLQLLIRGNNDQSKLFVLWLHKTSKNAMIKYYQETGLCEIPIVSVLPRFSSVRAAFTSIHLFQSTSNIIPRRTVTQTVNTLKLCVRRTVTYLVPVDSWAHLNHPDSLGGRHNASVDQCTSCPNTWTQASDTSLEHKKLVWNCNVTSTTK